MSKKKVLTFAFMDPPFESEQTVTFFRLLDSALNNGVPVRVFAYEGAAALSFARQEQHGNNVHGRNLEEEAHPLTKDWVTALQTKALSLELSFEWVNCGLCVDERGVNETVEGCDRGGPADFWGYATNSFNTLTIGTK